MGWPWDRIKHVNGSRLQVKELHHSTGANCISSNQLVHTVPKVKLDIVCQTCYVYSTQTMIANEKYEGMLKRNLFCNTLEFPDKLGQ